MKMKKNIKNFSTGKSIHYTTKITPTKLEYNLCWILGLLPIITIIIAIFFNISIWLKVVLILGSFSLFFITAFIILFSKKHEEERIENERKY